jgi:alpha-tubulin suppressor-like RCC1 family protein
MATSTSTGPTETTTTTTDSSTTDSSTTDSDTSTDGPTTDSTTGGACDPGFETCPSGCCLVLVPDRLAVGEQHTCALSLTGSVQCWGKGGLIGVDADSSAPVQVPGLATGVVAISGNASHTCALLAGGGVKCWGGNYWGSLGDGEPGINIVVKPVSALGLNDVEAIWAGNRTTCARRSDGEIWCWGSNGDGQLGTGTIASTVGTPTLAKELTGIAVVAPSAVHTCGLAGGAVKCWGRNHVGQLGDDSLVNSLTPVEVVGLAQSASFIIQTHGAHSCAVAGSGAPLCWGSNINGVFGNGDNKNINDTPQLTMGLPGPVVGLSTGRNHTCALLDSGTVWCWGIGGSGQLGIGTMANHKLPVEAVELAAPAVAIGVGEHHTCARTVDDAIYCWGNNQYGQLGTGDLVWTTKPALVKGL